VIGDPAGIVAVNAVDMPGQMQGADTEAGLLRQLAPRRLLRRLAEFLRPARQRPSPCAGGRPRRISNTSSPRSTATPMPTSGRSG
jgi:hypothetical protein